MQSFPGRRGYLRFLQQEGAEVLTRVAQHRQAASHSGSDPASGCPSRCSCADCKRTPSAPKDSFAVSDPFRGQDTAQQGAGVATGSVEGRLQAEQQQGVESAAHAGANADHLSSRQPSPAQDGAAAMQPGQKGPWWQWGRNRQHSSAAAGATDCAAPPLPQAPSRPAFPPAAARCTAAAADAGALQPPGPAPGSADRTPPSTAAAHLRMPADQQLGPAEGAAPAAASAAVPQGEQRSEAGQQDAELAQPAMGVLRGYSGASQAPACGGSSPSLTDDESAPSGAPAEQESPAANDDGNAPSPTGPDSMGFRAIAERDLAFQVGM